MSLMRLVIHSTHTKGVITEHNEQIDFHCLSKDQKVEIVWRLGALMAFYGSVCVDTAV